MYIYHVLPYVSMSMRQLHKANEGLQDQLINFPFIPIHPNHPNPPYFEDQVLGEPKKRWDIFSAGFSNFSVVVTHVLANWLFNKLSYKKLRETLANKFLSCHKSLQYTYHETLKATEICIKNS